MLQSSSVAAEHAIESRCTPQHRSARSCSGTNFARVAKALWPEKTAEHLAAAARCAVRTANYYLSGEREPSARALAAVINELLA